MALARVIAARREDAAAVERELRARGFHTEIVPPGETPSHPAEVEIAVEQLSAEAAAQRLHELEAGFDGDLLIGRGVSERLNPQPAARPEPGHAAKVAQPVEATALPEQPPVAPRMRETGSIATAEPAAHKPEVKLPEKTIEPRPPAVPVAARSIPPKPARPKRKPVIGPMIKTATIQAGSTAGRLLSASGRLAARCWQAAQFASASTRNRIRQALPAIGRQASDLVLAVNRASSESGRVLMESYTATQYWWRERQRRKQEARLPYETLRTAESAKTPVHVETQTRLSVAPHKSRRSAAHQRDWQMALVGAVIASCVVVIVFGITSRHTSASAITPSITQPVTAESAPSAVLQPAAQPVESHPVRIQNRASLQSARRRPTKDHNEAADDVVVRHLDTQPSHPLAQTNAGVKYYSDDQ